MEYTADLKELLINEMRLSLFNDLVKAIIHARDTKIKDYIDSFAHAGLSKEEAIIAANKSDEVIYYNSLLDKVKEIEEL